MLVSLLFFCYSAAPTMHPFAAPKRIDYRTLSCGMQAAITRCDWFLWIGPPPQEAGGALVPEPTLSVIPS